VAATGVVDGREEGFKPLAGSLMDGHEFGFQCAGGVGIGVWQPAA